MMMLTMMCQMRISGSKAEGDEEDDDTSEAIVDSKDMQLTAEL